MPKKLPKNATRVFHGQIFDVFHWPQKQFDGTIQTFERLQRPDTVQILPVSGDKIILQIQQQPDWHKPCISLPGGRADTGEDKLTAAKRELLEETGYTASDWRLWNKNSPYEKIIWTIFTYIARGCERKQDIKPDAGEKITLKPVSFDELLMLSDEDDFRDPHIKNYLYKARLDKKFRQTFYSLLFTKPHGKK